VGLSGSYRALEQQLHRAASDACPICNELASGGSHEPLSGDFLEGHSHRVLEVTFLRQQCSAPIDADRTAAVLRGMVTCAPLRVCIFRNKEPPRRLCALVELGTEAEAVSVKANCMGRSLCGSPHCCVMSIRFSKRNQLSIARPNALFRDFSRMSAAALARIQQQYGQMVAVPASAGPPHQTADAEHSGGRTTRPPRGGRGGAGASGTVNLANAARPMAAVVAAAAAAAGGGARVVGSGHAVAPLGMPPLAGGGQRGISRAAALSEPTPAMNARNGSASATSSSSGHVSPLPAPLSSSSMPVLQSSSSSLGVEHSQAAAETPLSLGVAVFPSFDSQQQQQQQLQLQQQHQQMQHQSPFAMMQQPGMSPMQVGMHGALSAGAALSMGVAPNVPFMHTPGAAPFLATQADAMLWQQQVRQHQQHQQQQQQHQFEREQQQLQIQLLRLQLQEQQNLQRAQQQMFASQQQQQHAGSMSTVSGSNPFSVGLGLQSSFVGGATLAASEAQFASSIGFAGGAPSGASTAFAPLASLAPAGAATAPQPSLASSPTSSSASMTPAVVTSSIAGSGVPTAAGVLSAVGAALAMGEVPNPVQVLRGSLRPHACLLLQGVTCDHPVVDSLALFNLFGLYGVVQRVAYFVAPESPPPAAGDASSSLLGGVRKVPVALVEFADDQSPGVAVSALTVRRAAPRRAAPRACAATAAHAGFVARRASLFSAFLFSPPRP
jgi:hypothetical protein